MTWGAMLRALLTDPSAWVFAFVVGAFCAAGGYFYGASVEQDRNEAKNNASLVETYKEVRQVEKTTTNNVNATVKENEHSKKLVAASADVLTGEFNGLRFRAACPSMPTVTADPSKLDRSARSERLRPSEEDFDGITRKVIELGRDYDNAINQIKDLAKAAELYRQACSLD